MTRLPRMGVAPAVARQETDQVAVVVAVAGCQSSPATLVEVAGSPNRPRGSYARRMANAWFESVEVAQRRAERRLPKSVYMALVAGADRGVTLADNVAAFGELRLRPVTAGQPATREMNTVVMGQPVSMPVVISPTGVQAVHPDGEL